MHLLLLLLLLLLPLAVSALPEQQQQQYTSLVHCLTAHNVPTQTSSSSSSANYTQLVQPYNLRTPASTPIAVVLASTQKHVISAMHCANSFQTKVAVRSGGHSYAGYGLGGRNGSLVIDTRHLRALAVNPATGVASVGAGRRLGDIATALFAAEVAGGGSGSGSGGRAMAHGICPGVGIAGHALHGGFGFASRRWGTALDHVVALDVVLPNATAVTLTARSGDRDLWWALRGAGSSFGVVTRFGFRTHVAPRTAVAWNYTFPATSSVEGRVDVFLKAQQWAVRQPKEMAVRLFVLTPAAATVGSGLDSGSGSEFVVSGAYWGAKSEFEALVAPLLELWPEGNGTVASVVELPYLDALRRFANDEVLGPQPLDYDAHMTFYAKSLTTTHELRGQDMRRFLTFAIDTAAGAPVAWYVIFDLYGGLSSAMAKQPDSSYAAGASMWTVQLMSLSWTFGPPYPEAGYAYLDELAQSLKGGGGGGGGGGTQGWGAYVNYIDDRLTPEEAHRVYYGDRYPRLRAIKKRVDPEGRLWNPLGVGVEDESV